ncbi:MAG TPA: SDR family oxidoreductase, partial [Chloroflexia bacterium]|nr:SDR family oxidoreductase [Chloroflexia bacterium]
MTYPYLRGKVALITGASRGIGAATALALAAQGADLVLNYRSKAGRAEKVAAAAQAHGVRALPVAADLTVRDDVRALVARTQQAFGRLDVLVLNASGGLEKEQTAANPDYAMLLNRDAQVWTLAEALSALHAGGRIVFVTSHWAHFYGQAWQYPIYEPV